eukprot:1186410-Prorocentrum_minimum.AAC.4
MVLFVNDVTGSSFSELVTRHESITPAPASRIPWTLSNSHCHDHVLLQGDYEDLRRRLYEGHVESKELCERRLRGTSGVGKDSRRLSLDDLRYEMFGRYCPVVA